MYPPLLLSAALAPFAISHTLFVNENYTKSNLKNKQSSTGTGIALAILKRVCLMKFTGRIQVKAFTENPDENKAKFEGFMSCIAQ